MKGILTVDWEDCGEICSVTGSSNRGCQASEAEVESGTQQMRTGVITEDKTYLAHNR